MISRQINFAPISVQNLTCSWCGLSWVLGAKYLHTFQFQDKQFCYICSQDLHKAFRIKQRYLSQTADSKYLYLEKSLPRAQFSCCGCKIQEKSVDIRPGEIGKFWIYVYFFQHKYCEDCFLDSSVSKNPATIDCGCNPKCETVLENPKAY